MSDTFLCLLCQGVVSSRPNRYEDHLKLEHKVYFHMVWILEKTKQTIGKKPQENLPKNPQRTFKFSKLSKNKGLVNKKIKKENVFAESLLEESVDGNVETVSEDVPNKVSSEQRKVKKLNSFGCSVCPDISFEKKSEALAHLKSHEAEKNYVKKQKNNPISGNVKIEPSLQNSNEQVYGDDITKNGVDETIDENKTPELLVHRGQGRARTFSCSTCPLEKFDQREKAKKHIRTHIPLLDRKQLMCEGCKERYATKISLEKHVPVCQGIQIRPCPSKKCDETFDNNYDLKKHIREHKRRKLAEKAGNALNPLSCKRCSKTLKTKKSLKNHLMKKHGEDSKIKVKKEKLTDLMNKNGEEPKINKVKVKTEVNTS